jgi:AcrR family transcriptional regulator
MSKPDGQTAALRSGRRPGSPDTRQQILDSARKVFAANGFNKASIRKIATNAGVDPALVHHYFRSKDELFLATVDVPINPREVVEQLLRDGTEGLGGRMVAAILGVWDSTAGSALLAALRTAIGDPGSTRALSQFVTAEIITRLLKALGYPPAEVELRGALVASQVLGMIVGRYVLAVGALPRLQPDVIAANIGPTLQTYLTGVLPTPGVGHL